MARTQRGSAGAGVIGVVGARGGAGATVTAAALGAELARRGTAVLVETGAGPSVDTALGLEANPGLRWPDLTGAIGAVDAELLAQNLMRWRGCAVLPTDDVRPGPPPVAVVPDVLTALATAHASVVLDLDRAAVLGAAVHDVAGRGAAPRDRSSRDRSSRDGVLRDVVPRDGFLRDVVPRDGSLRDVFLRDVAPRDGSSRDVSLRDVAPRDRSSRDVASLDGSSQDLASSDGSLHDVASRDVAPRDVDAGQGGEREGYGATLLAACRTVLVVVPRDVLAVAGARLLRDALVSPGRRVGLVTRGPAPGGLGAAEVARAVGLPVVASLPRVRELGGALDRGAGPVLPPLAARAVARLAGRLT